MSSVHTHHQLATTARRGLIPPLSGATTDFLNGLNNWNVPAGGGGGASALLQCGTASGIAPSGSVGANGALTLGTSLALVYDEGIWLYFPAGACYSGSLAGNYWVVMSSATLGTIYDIKLGANAPYIPTSPPAIVDAGPGAYTGATIEVTLATFTITANTIKPNEFYDFNSLATIINNANVKTKRLKFNGTQVLGLTYTTSGCIAWRTIFAVQNNHFTMPPSSGMAPGNHSSASQILSVPITSTITITLTGQLAVATDFFILNGAKS